MSHATPYNTDDRVLCADGIYRWFNARGVPVLNRHGSIREWVGVCLNVPGQNRYAAGRAGPRPEPRPRGEHDDAGPRSGARGA